MGKIEKGRVIPTHTFSAIIAIREGIVLRAEIDTTLILKQTDPNCKLEDKAEDEVLDCKKRPDEGEELEEEAVHSCDSCLQVFESLSDITEHKINQCQLAGGVHSYLDYYQTYALRISTVLMRQGFIEQTHTALCFRDEVIAGREK
ncbi:hypothetical protein AAES_145416 [Amazona aestiva]|uniref:Zinc finger protein 521 n=1 Tax=Amazona aestiva TaxID=12930 RepID=A0A0Q3P4M4_AMAAE|nr:hypothetical protein AAES_145416 [Amazona aestiva]